MDMKTREEEGTMTKEGKQLIIVTTGRKRINARNELEKSLQVGSNELPWLITSSRILFFRLAKNSLGQSSRAR